MLRETLQFSKKILLSSPSRRALVEPVFLNPRIPSLESSLPQSHPLDKRQTQILAIPTTYAGLNAGPQPGALVGIVVGSIAGFIIILYIILTLFRLQMGRGEVIEEKIIRHRRRRPSRSVSRTSRSASRNSRVISDTSPRRERIIREEETVIVEEHMSASIEDEDVVEVIEEHSPERRPQRKPTRSGFRTVDPAEFGGGGGPVRKVGRR